MRGNNRKSIASIGELPQLTTMNVIDGQAGIVRYSSLIFYSLTIDNILNIIVLLILAAVSIATLTGENGILTQAGKAKEQTEIAEAKEQAKIDIAAWIADKLEKGENATVTNSNIQSILTGKDYVQTAGADSFTTVKGGHEIPYSDLYSTTPSTPTVEGAKTAGTVFDTNTEIEDTYGNKITIPEGFKIATDSATDVTGGVVIEDANHENTVGSQFVWIPVGKIYTTADEATKESTAKTINLDRYTFASDGTPTAQGENKISNYFQELATSSYGNTTAKDIEGFKTSVTKNGGYYIGRYEASIETERTAQTDDNGLGQVAVKGNKPVYNYVTQPQAATLSRSMYSSGSFTSDLINSYAWDTAIVFIQEFSGDPDYSRQKGLQSTLAKTGEATDGTNQDVRCNIYDMAGNTYEWTTETYSYTNVPCVSRGGYCNSSFGYTSVRGNDFTPNAYVGSAFRPTLYVK